MIIDSHLHLNSFEKDFSKAERNLLEEMKENGIDYAIVIPDNEPNTNCADLETVLNLVDSKLFIVGTLMVDEVKDSFNRVDRLFKEEKIKGFKIFPGHDPVYPTDKRWFPIYNLCLKYDLPLIIHTGMTGSRKRESAKYNDPKYIVEIARKYPHLKIIIAHYFWPEVDYCYKITRGFENIYFDTSALMVKEVVKETGLDNIKRVLKKTIKDNPESVLFGTDYITGSFKKHIDLINSLGILNKEKVFWQNANKLFKLGLKKRNRLGLFLKMKY